MATEPKSNPSATIAVAAEVFAKPSLDLAPLEKGTVLRFNAPFGDLYHPWDNTCFQPGGEMKHAVDDWINLQYVNGKLVVAAD